MRKITYWLTLLLIFTIPWEDIVSISAIGSLTRLLGLAVAGCWFLTILIEGKFRKPLLFHALVLFFFLWSILSYVWTLDPARTLERIKTYAQIFILMMIIWEMLQDHDELNAALQAYVLGAFVPILSTLSNYLRGVSAVKWQVRYSATGVNAVDMALILLLGLPIAWHLFTYSYKKIRVLAIINLLYLPLSVFTILLTASRTSLFAIVPAVIFIAWPKKMDLGRMLLMLAFLIFGIMVLRTLLPASIVERLASATTSISSADIGGRVGLWADAFAVFIEHPLFGSGSGTLSSLIGSLSHQTFLSVLAETGLVGLALFITIVIYIFNQLFKIPKDYTGLWVSTFFIWFIGVLSLSFEFRKITWLFFSFMFIEGCSLRKKWLSKKENVGFSEAEEKQVAGSSRGVKGFAHLIGERDK